MNPDDNPDVPAYAGEGYAQLRELFATVADLDETERGPWLAANVPDADLRAAVERLLEADRSDGGYLEVAADEHAARMDADEPLRPDRFVGERIGAFRLTRLIGKGGMAAVFLGEREDADFDQRVAIKLLRRGVYSEVEQRLFRRERQLLAALEHPNVSRLIDGGITPAGIPYLVIEYVDGVPITQHANERRLSVRRRVELFLIVCRAVEAAHRALIVHRDIKPSNILVVADGTVKLLDFGIAKLLEEDTENPTIGVFTPEYAAPEQLASAHVTTATDVYALGVLLYELLLGLRPEGTPTRRPSSVAKGSAGRSSSVPNPSTLARALRGDIDTIILKCLAPEPERRYASAGALADDVARHLAGKPVDAHPPSRWYRVYKFVQRHRATVAVAAILLLTILAAMTVALWQASVARYEAARANRVRDFVEDIFSPIENSVIETKQTSVHDLLANATTKLNKNAELAVGERIDLQLLFSRLHEKMGEPDEAQALAQQATKLAESKLSPDDPQAIDAEISYATALLEHDDMARAEPLLKSLETRVRGRRLVSGLPLVRLYDGLAEVADTHGDHDTALAHEQRALEERIAQSGPDSATTATGYNNVAISLDMSGHHAEAIEAFRHSYVNHLALEGPDSLETANARNNLAFAELQAGRWRAAQADFLAVEPLYEAAPNNKRIRNVRYWQGRCQLGTAVGGAQAQGACERAMRVTKEILKSTDVTWIARGLRFDIQMKSDVGDVIGARRELEQADALIVGAGDPVGLGVDDYLLAELDLANDNVSAAAKEFARSIQRIGRAFPEYLRLRALAGRALACSLAKLAEDACPADAETITRKELDALNNPWSPWLLSAHTAIARIDLSADRYAPAIERLQTAIANAEVEADAAQIHLLSARLWLIVAETRAQRCDRAVADWHAVSQTLAAHDLAQHPLLVSALTQLRQRSACDAGFEN